MITVLPADEAGWADVEAVLGAAAAPARCWCQRYKLRPRESFRSFPPEERAHRLREQTEGGPGCTTGLVARLDGEPAGWCAVEPRPAYTGMVRNQRVPWEGRDEDRADAGVWAVTCFVVRPGFRRRGVATALARTAAVLARDRGARAVEGYPMTTADALSDELHPGLLSVFTAAGFAEVTRPTVRRAVVRIDLAAR